MSGLAGVQGTVLKVMLGNKTGRCDQGQNVNSFQCEFGLLKLQSFRLCNRFPCPSVTIIEVLSSNNK